MGNLLDKHQKTEYRYKNKDLILYYPTDEQYEEIKQLVKDSIQIDKDMKVNGELQFKSVRFIIREITSISHSIDEMSDVEIQEKLNNGDRTLVLLYREIETLIQEIVDDVFYEYTQQIKEIDSLLNIANSNDNLERMKVKMNKFFKKYKVNMQFEDFMKIANNPNAIEELTNKLNIKNK